MQRKKTLFVATGCLAAGLWTVAPAMAQDVVKIGYTGPLSGGAALYGKNVLAGMEMAANEINAAGLEVAGKKVKLEIVALDDRYNPSEAATNTQRLVQEHKAIAVLTPHSGGAFAIQAINERLKILLLAYTSVPQISERGNTLTWRIPPEFTTYVSPFIDYAMPRFGKRVGIANADHDYAKAWTAAFKPAWEKAGGTVVADNPMSYNKAADFYSGVSRVLAGKPDVLFIGGASEPTGLVVKQARELGFKGGFILIDQAKMDEVARVTGGYKPLEGAIGVLPMAQIDTPQAQGFVARYQKLYPGKDPSTEVSYNYTAVQAMAKAMALAASTTDVQAVRAQLNAALKQLPAEVNPHGFAGLDARAGSIVATRLAVVESGKPVGRLVKTP